MPTLFDDIPIDRAPGEQAAAAKAGQAAYARNLAAVLGNGADWEFRDECTDLGGPLGRCACGHPAIRFEFTLHHKHDGRRVVVGSSCVKNYHGISEETAERIQAAADRMEAAIADAKRQARERAQDAEIQSLLAEWSAAEYAIDQECQRWSDCHHGGDRYAPWPIYRRPGYARRLAERGDGLHPHVKLPALKSKAGMAKRIRREIESARAYMNQVIGSY